jgi:hypothetical protein
MLDGRGREVALSRAEMKAMVTVKEVKKKVKAKVGDRVTKRTGKAGRG